MQTWVSHALSFLRAEDWLLQVVIVLCLTMLLSLIAKYVHKYLHKASLKTKRFWDDVFFESLYGPLVFMVWVIGLAYAIQTVGARFEGLTILHGVDTCERVSILLLIVWFVMRFIRKGQAAILNKGIGGKNVDVTSLHAIGQLLRVVVVIVAVLTLMQTLGFSISGLLAFGGASTVIIGLAAKDVLANFFGGFMIYLDKPFKVGDWIRSPDRNIEGTVEYIGWRLSRIRTFDKRPLYVPNAVFSNISVGKCLTYD